MISFRCLPFLIALSVIGLSISHELLLSDTQPYVTSTAVDKIKWRLGAFLAQTHQIDSSTAGVAQKINVALDKEKSRTSVRLKMTNRNRYYFKS